MHQTYVFTFASQRKAPFSVPLVSLLFLICLFEFNRSLIWIEASVSKWARWFVTGDLADEIMRSECFFFFYLFKVVYILSCFFMPQRHGRSAVAGWRTGVLKRLWLLTLHGRSYHFYPSLKPGGTGEIPWPPAIFTCTVKGA